MLNSSIKASKKSVAAEKKAAINKKKKDGNKATRAKTLLTDKLLELLTLLTDKLIEVVEKKLHQIMPPAVIHQKAITIE